MSFCYDDLYKLNGQAITIEYICPHCGESTVAQCGRCGNDILDVTRDDFDVCNLNCAIDAIRFSDFSLNRTKRLNYICDSCGNSFSIMKYGSIKSAKGVDAVARHRQRIKENATRQREERRKKEEQEKRESSAGRKKAVSLLRKLVDSQVLILDSNIWMNGAYDALFESLEDSLPIMKGSLQLYGPQFDEICNVKKKTAFKSFSNKSARCAISRIERLQESNLLSIEPLTIDAEKGAYADPLIVKLIMKHIAEGRDVVFLSDDKELRIRIRGLAKGKGSLEIMKGRELLPACIHYCMAGGIGFEAANPEEYYEQLHGEAEDTSEK